MIAVKTPIMGGKPEAAAIPRLRGRARRKTTNPDVASFPKFCVNPASPSLGN
jgi:hypothetical protein